MSKPPPLIVLDMKDTPVAERPKTLDAGQDSYKITSTPEQAVELMKEGHPFGLKLDTGKVIHCTIAGDKVNMHLEQADQEAFARTYGSTAKAEKL